MIMQEQAWDGFRGDQWRRAIDVRDFIQTNYTPYLGDDSFLAGPTPGPGLSGPGARSCCSRS